MLELRGSHIKVCKPTATNSSAEVLIFLSVVRSHISVRLSGSICLELGLIKPCGGEYIMVEKSCGDPLTNKWKAMSCLHRYKIIYRIVEMEITTI